MKSLYLQTLEEKQIPPNFWCSEEYFEKAGFKEYLIDEVIYIVDPNDDNILPPLSLHPGLKFKDDDCWSDLINYYSMNRKSEFLDYEYIYDPKSFLDLSGGKWKIFRKNIKKFPTRYPGIRYSSNFTDQQIMNFFNKWSDGLKWKEVQDGEVLTNYLFEGINRKVIIDKDDNILGINIWDDNFMYINYRFCLCLNFPFLSEYLRYKFYLEIVRVDNRRVNDGGVLDNPALKKFKNKLNPIRIREVCSWV